MLNVWCRYFYHISHLSIGKNQMEKIKWLEYSFWNIYRVYLVHISSITLKDIWFWSLILLESLLFRDNVII